MEDQEEVKVRGNNVGDDLDDKMSTLYFVFL